MTDNRTKRKNDDEYILFRRYRLDTSPTLFYGFFFTLILTIPIFSDPKYIGNNTVETGIKVTIPIIVFLIVWILHHLDYLVIHPDGLEWVQRGFVKMKVSWDTVQSFQAYETGGGQGSIKRTVINLKLNAMVTPQTNNWFIRHLFGQATNIIPLNLYTNVPFTRPYAAYPHLHLIKR